MELNRNYWDNSSYDDFISYLFSIRDTEYAKFHSNLGVGDNVIGVRTPILKRFAKEIYKGNYVEFLSVIRDDYYEEIILFGFIICYISELTESVKYLNIYKSKINNWANCDLFCSSYKIIKKNKEYFWKYISDNVSCDNIWIKRMCFVFIISYFIDKKYLDDIFLLCDKYNTNDYYVQMAVAWLISICYIKYPSHTLKYIKNNNLDNFTHNKTIQKIRDSYRVSYEDKYVLNLLKRK